MNVTKQQNKADDTPVVSPLVNDKTYGERWYSAIFDWGLNYWTNLLASAGFSQWAEHGTAEFKLPFMKNATTPRNMQASLAKNIEKFDPAMNGTLDLTKVRVPFTQIHLPNIPMPFGKGGGFKGKMELKYGAGTEEAADAIMQRCMARARSLTLLVPGFFIVIPTVWLGAKIKPWFVETINRHHYGDDAMQDPTMRARHQALEAEARPTFGGAIVARIATMFAAQYTAQLVGSENNILNKMGEKHNIGPLKHFAVDPITKGVGAQLGGALPEKVQERYSAFARSHGLDWSEEQIKLKNYLHASEEKAVNAAGLLEPKQKLEIMDYNTATKDLGRFIAADTFYTMVTALTIQPVVKLLRMIPGMSYKPKMPKNSAYFDSNATVVQPKTRVKVPANEYGEFTDRAETVTANASKADMPSASISNASAQGTLHQHEQQIA